MARKTHLCTVLQPNYQAVANLGRNAYLHRRKDYERLAEKRNPGSKASQMDYIATMDLLNSSTDGFDQKFYYQYDNLDKKAFTVIRSNFIMKLEN
jgi:hypothetical protein